MKKIIYIILTFFIPISGTTQYIGIKNSSKTDPEGFYYKIVNFDGKIVLTLDDNVFPFFSSFLTKKYMNESDNYEVEIKERWITRDESFFVTELNQSILPLTSPESTYIINFEGKLVKSYGKKFKYLSQPQNGIFIGYRQMEEDKGSLMLSYLDERGEEIFKGREFWEATPFSDGHAIVQETKESDWKIIDITGKEVINLSKHIELPIVEAHAFINGFANISVERKIEDAKVSIFQLKTVEDSAFHYFNVPLNSGRKELRAAYVLYRVNLKGEFQRLNWKTSILNDIYHRSFFTGAEFDQVVDGKKSINNEIIIDSVVGRREKYYLVGKMDSVKYVVNQSGEKLEFPKRYIPMKCIQNEIIGKRRNKYVLFNPETKEEKYFIDKSPKHFGHTLLISWEQNLFLEEFTFVYGKILKTNPFGLSALLTKDGDVLNDFDESEFDLSYSPFTKLMHSEIYECPDEIDYEEIKELKSEYLHLKCKEIDLQELSSLKMLKMLLIRDVNNIKNPEILVDLLNRNIDIFLSGSITLHALKLDKSKVISGGLYLNDEEIIPKR